MKRIDGSLVMVHQHAAHTLRELLEVGKTPSSPDPVLQHAPEAFNRIEVVAAPRWQAMQPKLRVPVGQRRCELVRSVEATPVDDHHDRFPGMAKEHHYLMDIWAKPLCIKMGDDFIEDFRSAILDRAYNAEQHAVPLCPDRASPDTQWAAHTHQGGRGSGPP